MSPLVREKPRHAATRRFTISDGMILIVAAAMGLALERACIVFYRQALREELDVRDWVLWGIQCTLFAGALGLMAIRLRRPRPPLRRVFRQPGFVACVAILFITSVEIINRLPFFLRATGGSRRWVASKILEYAVLPSILNATHIATGVTLAWVVLGMSVGWRPEPSWIDRLGRGLGVGWIIVFLYFMGENLLGLL